MVVEWGKYRRAGGNIEAFQWDGKEIPPDALTPEEWETGKFRVNKYGSAAGDMSICTLHGIVIAEPGDWIIRAPWGEIYPVKPDVFVRVYEKAE